MKRYSRFLLMIFFLTVLISPVQAEQVDAAVISRMGASIAESRLMNQNRDNKILDGRLIDQIKSGAPGSGVLPDGTLGFDLNDRWSLNRRFESIWTAVESTGLSIAGVATRSSPLITAISATSTMAKIVRANQATSYEEFYQAYRGEPWWHMGASVEGYIAAQDHFHKNLGKPPSGYKIDQNLGRMVEVDGVYMTQREYIQRFPGRPLNIEHKFPPLIEHEGVYMTRQQYNRQRFESLRGRNIPGMQQIDQRTVDIPDTNINLHQDIYRAPSTRIDPLPRMPADQLSRPVIFNRDVSRSVIMKPETIQVNDRMVTFPATDWSATLHKMEQNSVISNPDLLKPTWNPATYNPMPVTIPKSQIDMYRYKPVTPYIK